MPSRGEQDGRAHLAWIEREIRDNDERFAPSLVTVASVEGDLVTVQLPEAETASAQRIARLAGPPVAVGDRGLVWPLAGGGSVFGSVGGVARSVDYDGGSQDDATTPSTTNAWATAIQRIHTLPPGTWQIRVRGTVLIRGSSDAYSLDSQLIINGVAAGFSRVPGKLNAWTRLESVWLLTNVAGQIDYRLNYRNSISTETAYAENPSITLDAVRTG